MDMVLPEQDTRAEDGMIGTPREGATDTAASPRLIAYLAKRSRTMVTT